MLLIFIDNSFQQSIIFLQIKWLFIILLPLQQDLIDFRF